MISREARTGFSLATSAWLARHPPQVGLLNISGGGVIQIETAAARHRGAARRRRLIAATVTDTAVTVTQPLAINASGLTHPLRHGRRGRHAAKGFALDAGRTARREVRSTLARVPARGYQWRACDAASHATLVPGVQGVRVHLPITGSCRQLEAAMTTVALILPLGRVSPVRIPVRGLVLGGTDNSRCWSPWSIAIVPARCPSSSPAALAAAVSLFVWPDGYGRGYGWGKLPRLRLGRSVWRRRRRTPARCCGRPPARSWARHQGRSPSSSRPAPWAAGRGVAVGPSTSARTAVARPKLLAEGHLHVRTMVSRAITPLIMLTDTNPAVLTDPETEVILLAGVPPA